MSKQSAPAGWLDARDIARATGFRIQAMLGMLSKRETLKREPTIWTRVTGREWLDMPGGGREHRQVWEEYEAFPGLSWIYRPQRVKDPAVYLRWGGDYDFCFPESEGFDIIKRCRAWRTACNLRVPPLPAGFYPEGDDTSTEEANAPKEVEVMGTNVSNATIINMRFQPGHNLGWAYAFQHPGATRHPFLNRRNGKVLVLTPRNRLRAWGRGNTGNPQVGDTWEVMVNGEHATLEWIGSRWQTRDPLEAGIRAKMVG